MLYDTIELREGETWATRWGRVPLLWLAVIAWLVSWALSPDLPERLRRLVSRPVRSPPGG